MLPGLLSWPAGCGGCQACLQRKRAGRWHVMHVHLAAVALVHYMFLVAKYD